MIDAMVGGVVVLVGAYVAVSLDHAAQQRGALRRSVDELTMRLPLWMSRFNAEMATLEGREYPPAGGLDSPAFLEQRAIQRLVLEIQGYARWPLIRRMRRVRSEASRVMAIVMSVRDRVSQGHPPTLDEQVSIATQLHTLSQAASGKRPKVDELLEVYRRDGYEVHPPL